jgi:NADH-quinone oxidoreductase subunit J
MSAHAPQLLFYLLASAALGTAVITITRRELVSAAISLIGTFFCLSGIYLLLHAPFVAVIQLLVYAGAIMTLFVFVVMMLGREERDPWLARGVVARAVAAMALLFLVARMAVVVFRQFGSSEGQSPPAGPPLGDGFGGVVSVGRVLFSEHLLPFEVVSVILLVAVVGVLLVAGARRLLPDTVAGANPRGDGSVEHGSAEAGHHDAAVRG